MGLAITTLYLVSPGPEVLTQGQRRGVAPPGCRGHSDRKIGWNGVNLALSRGDELVTRWQVAAEADPQPALASKRQAQPQPRVVIALEFHAAVA